MIPQSLITSRLISHRFNFAFCRIVSSRILQCLLTSGYIFWDPVSSSLAMLFKRIFPVAFCNAVCMFRQISSSCLFSFTQFCSGGDLKSDRSEGTPCSTSLSCGGPASVRSCSDCENLVCDFCFRLQRSWKDSCEGVVWCGSAPILWVYSERAPFKIPTSGSRGELAGELSRPISKWLVWSLKRKSCLMVESWSLFDGDSGLVCLVVEKSSRSQRTWSTVIGAELQANQHHPQGSGKSCDAVDPDPDL